MKFWQRDVFMWVLIFFFFFSLVFWVFCCLVEAKKLFLGWEDRLDITAFPPFITVCRNPWSSWLWPGHLLISWIMGLFLSLSNEVKLTTFLDKTKYCRRPKLVKKVDSMIKVNLHMFSFMVFEVCWSLVFMPPNRYDTLVQQISIPLKEIIPLPPNQIPLSLLMKIINSHRRFGLWWLCYL